MRLSAASVLASIMAFAGCVREQKKPPPAFVAHPHYELGYSYRIGNRWYYPEEDFSSDQTGLANILADGTWLTADGEVEDAGALTAAMRNIQLPSVVTVTNLENGRFIQVRVNDRGPADPGRMIGLSPRAALLLAMNASGVARVRVQVDGNMSHRVLDQVGGGPQLAIKTAPRGIVTVETLAPLGAKGGSGRVTQIGGADAEVSGPVVPVRLPEVIHAVAPQPGQLWLRAGSFTRFQYAKRLAAKLAGLGGDVLHSRDGRQEIYEVRAGPFRDVAEADAALQRAFGAGVVDARITVE